MLAKRKVFKEIEFMDFKLENVFKGLRALNQNFTVLTGAGISAESGIPTFRGPEGFWTIGSKNYTPQEMATFAMFSQNPEAVWAWYLYRLGVCLTAQPNPAHFALVEIEKILGDSFTLITQNIDNLHLAAGNSEKRTYQIHGNIQKVRCSKECNRKLLPLPPLPLPLSNESLSSEIKNQLRCPQCKSWLRPHVLWFDECYDEEYFRLKSSLEAAHLTDVLLVVGTSGATNLPAQIVERVAKRRGKIIEINPNESNFTSFILEKGGNWIQSSASEALPKILKFIL